MLVVAAVFSIPVVSEIFVLDIATFVVIGVMIGSLLDHVRRATAESQSADRYHGGADGGADDAGHVDGGGGGAEGGDGGGGSW